MEEGKGSVTARSDKFGLADSINVAVLDIRGLSKVEIAPEQIIGSVQGNGRSNPNNRKRVVDGNKALCAEDVGGKTYWYIKYVTNGTGDSRNCSIAEIEV
jgi:hypothetical protein